MGSVAAGLTGTGRSGRRGGRRSRGGRSSLALLGSLLGTHLALKHGTGFVRGIFIVVVSTLILKTGYDAFLR